jgi:hypothetical protein
LSPTGARIRAFDMTPAPWPEFDAPKLAIGPRRPPGMKRVFPPPPQHDPRLVSL